MDNLLNGNALYISRTPLRISFFGGGTDLPGYYQRDFGAVISTAITKYLYVTVKRHGELFKEPIRLNYSKTEFANSVDEVENDVARECMKFLEVEPPLYISTVADVPEASGLGSSSSFAVGLLLAFHALKGQRVSMSQIADEACHIEIDILKKPIGKQDQYAGAFGGLNYFRFNKDGRVTVEPLSLKKETLQKMFSHLMLFWTGITRQSSSILKEQKSNIDSKLEFLNRICAQAKEVHDELSTNHFDPRSFGAKLHEGWLMKKNLASQITDNQIDRWYEAALKAGAHGGKIAGAGGGGFLLFVAPPEKQGAVRKALHGLLEIDLKPEVHGARLLLPHF